jgi:hypothetical protein
MFKSKRHGQFSQTITECCHRWSRDRYKVRLELIGEYPDDPLESPNGKLKTYPHLPKTLHLYTSLLNPNY